MYGVVHAQSRDDCVTENTNKPPIYWLSWGASVVKINSSPAGPIKEHQLEYPGLSLLLMQVETQDSSSSLQHARRFELFEHPVGGIVSASLSQCRHALHKSILDPGLRSRPSSRIFGILGCALGRSLSKDDSHDPGKTPSCVRA